MPYRDSNEDRNYKEDMSRNINLITILDDDDDDESYILENIIYNIKRII